MNCRGQRMHLVFNFTTNYFGPRYFSVVVLTFANSVSNVWFCSLNSSSWNWSFCWSEWFSWMSNWTSEVFLDFWITRWALDSSCSRTVTRAVASPKARMENSWKFLKSQLHSVWGSYWTSQERRKLTTWQRQSCICIMYDSASISEMPLQPRTVGWFCGLKFCPYSPLLCLRHWSSRE